MSDDRREHARHSVWFPVSIESPAGEGFAISYDVSVGGLLVACPGQVDVGSEVTATFRLHKDAPEHRVKGKVLRIEPTGDEGPWRYRIAVAFESPVPEIQELLDRAGS